MEWLEHGPLQVVSKIYFALSAIGHLKPDAMASTILDRAHIQHVSSSLRKLLKGRDRHERLTGARSMPVSEELLAMERQPLEYQRARSSREFSAHLSVSNGHRDLELAVRCVKMRRIVIAVEDRDDDAKEPGDDRHSLNLEPMPVAERSNDAASTSNDCERSEIQQRGVGALRLIRNEAGVQFLDGVLLPSGHVLPHVNLTTAQRLWAMSSSMRHHVSKPSGTANLPVRIYLAGLTTTSGITQRPKARPPASASDSMH